MNKKMVVVGFVLLLIVPVLGLIAGGQEETETKEKVTVTFMVSRGSDAQAGAMSTISENYNSTVGLEEMIEVKYEPVPGGWPEYTQKLLARIAANNAPDIVNLSPLNKVDFTTNGYLLDLKPYMDEIGFDTDMIYESNIDSWKGRNGEYFGIGHGAMGEAIYYNKDLFEEAGLPVPSLDWSNSWTWEEFGDYARALTKGSGVSKQYGFFVEPQLGWMTPIFKAYGGSVGLLDGSALNMNHPGSVEALEFLVDLMWVDETCPKSVTIDATPAGDLFKTGRLAMHWDGSWWMGSYMNADLDFEWGVLPLPSGPKGAYTGMWIDAYNVPANAKYPREALKVIEYFVGSDSTNVYIDHGIFGIPANKEVARERGSELYKDFPEQYSKVWIDSAGYGTQPEYTLNWNEVWDMTNTVIERIELGELSVQEACDLMVDESIRIIKAVE